MVKLRSLLIFAFVLLLCSLAVAQAPPEVRCNQFAVIDNATASGAAQVIAAPAAGPVIFLNDGTTTAGPTARVHVCAVSIMVTQTATPATFGLVYGTGTNCATGQNNLTPQWAGTASAKDIWNITLGGEAPLVVPMGNAVCLKLSAAVTKGQVLVIYSNN